MVKGLEGLDSSEAECLECMGVTNSSKQRIGIGLPGRLVGLSLRLMHLPSPFEELAAPINLKMPLFASSLCGAPVLPAICRLDALNRYGSLCFLRLVSANTYGTSLRLLPARSQLTPLFASSLSGAIVSAGDSLMFYSSPTCSVVCRAFSSPPDA